MQYTNTQRNDQKSNFKEGTAMYDASLGYKEAFLYAVPSLNSTIVTK